MNREGNKGTFNLLERVAKEISERRMFGRGESILIAVSGGLDSMVLLHVLARLSGDNGWRLAVAHFNHCLRGRSSDADERLVERAARKLGLPFIADRANVRQFARDQKLSIEMAARRLRHRFLVRVAMKRNIRRVALAHHADDQVELFFLRLLRGAGGEGLAGMKWSGPSPENARVRLVRPLLGESRKELLAWAAREKIPYREDASNAQMDFQRNRIRHELLPLLAKRYQPGLDRVILRQMEIAGAEAEFAIEAARKWLASKRRTGFASLPIALQRRVIQLQLIKERIPADFDLIEQLREASDRPVSVSPKTVVSRDDAGVVKTMEPMATGFNTNELRIRLRGRSGEISFESTRVSWDIIEGGDGILRARKKPVNCEHFDADKVGRVICLRHWRPGDRFEPIGLGRAAKLQDLLTNQKIPSTLRRGLLVGATTAGELFWVEGLRMAERFKLDKSTVRELKWCWKRV